MWTLTSRGAIAAVDGAQVADTPVTLPQLHILIVAQFSVVTAGAPATFNMRAAIEGTMDGTNWFQLVRFKDITAVGQAWFRSAGQTAAAAADVAASALSGAAAATVVTDTPWPRQIRATTMLQALTGGAAPTVTPIVVLSEGN